jgi:indoleamine 2,3-dioxygenase
VSEHLDLPPVLTYAASNLWNFASTGTDFTNMGDIRSQHTFTGTKDESWFFMISVAMEAQAATIIPTMMRAFEAVESEDFPTVISALNDLTCCIKMVGALLERMYEHCDPLVFYYQIRPFLAGSKNMEVAGLPKGVFYDEGNGKGNWKQLRGGSNGQSSMIQFFDIVLSVKHESEGNSSPHSESKTRGDKLTGHGQTAKTKSFHEEVREYMPKGHREFLEHISKRKSIRDMAMNGPLTRDRAILQFAYTTATTALSEFRNKHIQIVTRYIILPSRKQNYGNADRGHNLATASKRIATTESTEELKGTGGTTLLPFLKQARDETCIVGNLERSTRN